MFRRIAAACALIALVAMGLAVPAEARPGRDASSTIAGGHDAPAIVPTRRVRERVGAELDGQPDGATGARSGLVRLLWLVSAASLDTPVAVAASFGAAPMGAAPRPAFASRTSRGPPARS